MHQAFRSPKALWPDSQDFTEESSTTTIPVGFEKFKFSTGMENQSATTAAHSWTNRLRHKSHRGNELNGEEILHFFSEMWALLELWLTALSFGQVLNLEWNANLSMPVSNL